VPRDPGDVLDYFLPTGEPSRASPSAARRKRPEPARPVERPAALPILSLPIGEREVMRSAFAWNLAVEVARFGGPVGVLTPNWGDVDRLFPECDDSEIRSGDSPDVVLRICDAQDLPQLEACAITLATELSQGRETSALILVRVPPAWLDQAPAAPRMLSWLLLFSSSDPRDLVEDYQMAKQAAQSWPDAQIGITIHGARDLDQAQDAFDLLAANSATNLGCDLMRYGLVLDDLDIYRSIAARRPIGLEHPNSHAAHALRGMAGLIRARIQDSSRA